VVNPPYPLYERGGFWHDMGRLNPPYPLPERVRDKFARGGIISLSRLSRKGREDWGLNPLDNALRNIYSSSYQGIDTDGVKGTRIDICRM